MFRGIMLVLLIALPAYGHAPPSSTLANRLACTSAREGVVWTVVDCIDSACATGGGTTSVAFVCRSGSYVIDTTGGSSGGSGTPDDNSVTSAKIVDGAIVDADVNAAAGIAGTKIAAGTTTARGTLELATDGEIDAALAVNAADPRVPTVGSAATATANTLVLRDANADTAVRDLTARNINADAVIVTDPGDGLRGVIIEQNTTTIPNPNAGEGTLGFVGTRPAYRAPGWPTIPFTGARHTAQWREDFGLNVVVGSLLHADINWSITAASAPGTNAVSPATGNISLSTGAATDGYTLIHRGVGRVRPHNAMILEASIAQLTNLCDVTDDCIVVVGLCSDITWSDGIACAEGFWFEWDQAASANWRLRNATGGVTTTTDSGVAVVVTTFAHLAARIYHATAGTTNPDRVDWFVNDTQIGSSITTNISTTFGHYLLAGILKRAGTTARTIQLDYLSLTWEPRR